MAGESKSNFDALEATLLEQVKKETVDYSKIEYIAGVSCSCFEQSSGTVAISITTRSGKVLVQEHEKIALNMPIDVDGRNFLRGADEIVEFIQSILEDFEVHLFVVDCEPNARGFSLATLIGVRLNIPTIGISHTLVHQDAHDILARIPLELGVVGANFSIKNEAGTKIMNALRTRTGSCGIVYLSKGSVLSFKQSRRLLLQILTGDKYNDSDDTFFKWLQKTMATKEKENSIQLSIPRALYHAKLYAKANAFKSRGLAHIRLVSSGHATNDDFQRSTSVFEFAEGLGIDPEGGLLFISVDGKMQPLNPMQSFEDVRKMLGLEKNDQIEIVRGTDDIEESMFECVSRVVTCGVADLDLAKISITGRAALQKNEIVDKTIVFVIDVSGSMSGGRINQVLDALIPFVETIFPLLSVHCHIIKFNRHAQEVTLHKKPDGSLNSKQLRDDLRPGGGTKFSAASEALVHFGKKILKQRKTQLRLVFISDGEVDRDDAQNAHNTWKKFVEKHCTEVPFVDSIGIGSNHSADILDGYIQQDIGNYTKCLDSAEIKGALEAASDLALNMLQTSFELSSSVNLCLFADLSLGFNSKTITIFEEDFDLVYWVPLSQVKELIRNGLTIDSRTIPVSDGGVLANAQGSALGLEFYTQRLQGMIAKLRETTNQNQLKQLASGFRDELNQNKKNIDILRSAPSEVKQAQKRVQEVMQDPEATRSDKAEALKSLKIRVRAAKVHGDAHAEFMQVKAEVDELLKMILCDNRRLEEIRQHVVALHFSRGAAKRANRLAMDEEQLRKRDAFIRKKKNANKPEEKQIADLSDDIGSGCFLSCISLRECAADCDSLWICGRVNRDGGLAVANPELLRIEYVSPNLVSSEYFELAMESSYESYDIENAGFVDGARERINCRLFPMFGNLAHYKAAWVDVQRVLGHTVSGRYDISCPSYGGLFAVLGHLIMNCPASERMLRHILEEIVPSFRLILQNKMNYLYKGTSNQLDFDGPKVPLQDLSAQRIDAYMNSPLVRGPWWAEIRTIVADALLNIETAKLTMSADTFWLPLLGHAIRRSIRSIAVFDSENKDEVKAWKNHLLDLMHQLLFASNTKEEFEASLDAIELDTVEFWKEMYDIPKWKICDPKTLRIADQSSSSRHMDVCARVLERIHWQPLIQAAELLIKLQKGETEMSKLKPTCDAPMNLHRFLAAFADDVTINDVQLRAILLAAIMAPKKSWKTSCDDLGNAWRRPEEVMRYVAKHVLARRQKQWEKHLKEVALKKARAQHTRFPTLDKYGDLSLTKCAWCGRDDFRGGLATHYQEMECFEIVRSIRASRSILVSKPGMTLEEYEEKVTGDLSQEIYKTLTSKLWKLGGMGKYVLADGIYDDNEDLSLGRTYKFAGKKERMNVCLCGSIDSGKSTLGGHLLFQLGGMSHREYSILRMQAEKMNQEDRIFALFLDKTHLEVAQGITIEAKYREFYTQNYHYVLIDGPGHVNYIKNASRAQVSADVGVMVISATKGQFETAISKRRDSNDGKTGIARTHARMLNCMGVENIIVAVNKMDAIDYSEERFEEIKAEMTKILTKMGFKEKRIAVLPISGFTGENLLKPSPKMEWFKGFEIKPRKEQVQGVTFYDALNVQALPKRNIKKPFKMTVSRVAKLVGVGDVICGHVHSGTLSPEEELQFAVNGQVVKAHTVESWFKRQELVMDGDQIGIAIRGLEKVRGMPRIGDVMFKPAELSLRTCHSFRAMMFVQNHTGQIKCSQGRQNGFTPTVAVAAQHVPCMLQRILWKRGKATNMQKESDPAFVEAGDECEVIWQPKKKLYIEKYEDDKRFGRVLVLESNELVAIARCVDVSFH